jgi:hypothetical protein
MTRKGFAGKESLETKTEIGKCHVLSGDENQEWWAWETLLCLTEVRGA